MHREILLLPLRGFAAITDSEGKPFGPIFFNLHHYSLAELCRAKRKGGPILSRAKRGGAKWS